MHYYRYWLVAAGIISILFILEKTCLDFFADIDNGAGNLHAFLITILTLGIFAVACVNLRGIRVNSENIKKTAKDDFLLRISERYGSKEIFNARMKLHEFHIDVENEIIKNTI